MRHLIALSQIVGAGLVLLGLGQPALAQVGQKPLPKIDGGSEPEPKKRAAPAPKASKPADKGPGPLNLRDMPVGSGSTSSRGSGRQTDPPGAAELWRDADASPSCRPNKAASGQRQAVTQRWRTESRHNPDLDAGRCLYVDHGPSLYGGLINRCGHAVEVMFCNRNPVKDSWADAFNCRSNAFGAATIPAYGKATLHTHQTEAVVWGACVSPKAGVKHTKWEGANFMYWCMEEVRVTEPAPTADTAQPVALETCRPDERRRLEAQRAAAERQAEAERARLEPLWEQEALALKDEAEGRPRPAPSTSLKPPVWQPSPPATQTPASDRGNWIGEWTCTNGKETDHIALEPVAEGLRLGNRYHDGLRYRQEAMRPNGQGAYVWRPGPWMIILRPRDAQSLWLEYTNGQGQVNFQMACHRKLAASSVTSPSCTNANGQRLDDVHRHMDDLEATCQAELRAFNQVRSPQQAVDRNKLYAEYMGQCGAEAKKHHERELQYYLQRPHEYEPTALRLGTCLRKQRIQQLQKLGF